MRLSGGDMRPLCSSSAGGGPSTGGSAPPLAAKLPGRAFPSSSLSPAPMAFSVCAPSPVRRQTESSLASHDSTVPPVKQKLEPASVQAFVTSTHCKWCMLNSKAGRNKV